MNGLTEHLNYAIGNMLLMYVIVEHTTWHRTLPHVTSAYSTTVQGSNGFTRFRLVHRRKVTTSLDGMLAHQPGDDDGDDDSGAAAISQQVEDAH